MRRTTWPAAGRNLIACGLAALVVALAGCGGSSSTDKALTTGSSAVGRPSSAPVPEVTWAFNSSVRALNISTVPDLTSISILANVLQGALAYDSGGHLHLSLASSWRAVSPVVYTYTFRTGVRFSDGKPLTIDDVLYSMHRAMNPATGGAASSFYQSVKSIQQDGANRIKVTLLHPDPTWVYTPGHYSGWVVEKAAATRAGSQLGGPKGIPVGSGPYMITEIVPGDHVTLQRNPYYSGTRPKVAKIVVRFIADDATRLAAIQSGDIDGTSAVPLQDTPQWQRISSIRLLSSSSPFNAYVFFNTTKKPFDDVHVRRAFMYAFNRAAIVKRLLHGNARVATALIAPEMWVNAGLSAAQVEARSAELGPQYPYDLAKARAELAASKYPHGLSTSVVYTPDAPEVGAGLQALAQSLKQLHVTLNVREVSDADQSRVFTDPSLATITAAPGGTDYPDPLNLIGETMCGCQAPPNGFNISGYKSAAVDNLIAQATTNPDRASRVGQMFKLLAIDNSELPASVLWWDNSVTALSKKLVLTDNGTWSIMTPWMTHIAAAASQ